MIENLSSLSVADAAARFDAGGLTVSNWIARAAHRNRGRTRERRANESACKISATVRADFDMVK
jgi:hypothetical protein